MGEELQEQETNEGAGRPRLRGVYWVIWGLLLVLAILLGSAFSRAWALHEALKEKEAALEPMLEQQQTQHATLDAELEYVGSDEYVEEWARVDAGMTRPGEILALPLAPSPTPSPMPTPMPTPTPTPAPFWARWWQALTRR
jgi:cell division protein FtsB